MRARFLVAVATLTVLGQVSEAVAEIPKRLNFQGILLDSVEYVVPDGTYDLIFRIFDAGVGGTELWTETQTLQTENGLFNTFLGLSAPVPDSVFGGPDRWLEIQLAENSEPYEPRGKIGSVAYSYRTGSVDGATGGTITGALNVEGVGAIAKNSTGSIVFSPDEIGDLSVQLPDNAISSQELLDEPGLARNLISGVVDLTSIATSVNIVVCTVTVPSPGYINVLATGEARFESDVENANCSDCSTPNYFEYEIDEGSSGGITPGNTQRAGFSKLQYNETAWMPISINRTFRKLTAGQYVFRLEARNLTVGSTQSIRNASITATYYPSAYGTVVTAGSN